jgi:RNA polymerase sigma factor (sigma-70 family)
MEIRKEDEGRVWALFKDGDNDMFAAIFSAYSRKLYQYGLKFTKNRSLIEDSIQELFFELLKNRKTVGQTDHILRYLMKSFRFKLFRMLKHEMRYDHSRDSADYPFEIDFSIEHTLIHKEDDERRRSLFLKALDDLTPRQKEAIFLRYSNGLGYEEASEIMDMSLESCRNLIYRAVKAMKEAIGPYKKT